MNIEKAEYILNQGLPALRLVIDGKEALICDYKPAVLAAGYVAMSSRERGVFWEEILPPLVIPPSPGVSETPLVMEGMTNDPQVVALAREFHESIMGENGKSFAAGPIKIG